MIISIDNIKSITCSKFSLSKHAKYLELKSAPWLQYIFNTRNGELLEIGNRLRTFYYVDYSHTIEYGSIFSKNKTIFFYFDNGWLFDYKSNVINTTIIAESEYSAGILESYISVDLRIIILITEYNNRNVNDFIKPREIVELKKVHRNFGSSDRSLKISFFTFSGNKIRDFILPDCTPDIFDSQFLSSNGHLLIKSYEYSYLFNGINGELLRVFEGENVNLLHNNLIGHWEWYGYDAFFSNSQILDYNFNKIKIFDSASDNEQVSNIWWDNVLCNNESAFSIVSFRIKKTNDFYNRIVKFPLSDPNSILITDSLPETINTNCKLISVTDDSLILLNIKGKSLSLITLIINNLNFYPYESFKYNVDVNPFLPHKYIDIHTKNSKILPNGRFDTEHTDTGKLLYEYKYCMNKSIESKLLKVLVSCIRSLDWDFDVIIPIPPSNLDRAYQPVQELAELLRQSGFPVDSDYLIKKNKTKQLKTISDRISRLNILDEIFTINDKLRYKNKNVLLFDDIWRSGDTVTKAAEIIYHKGYASSVKVFTITKTRKGHF